MSLIAASTSSSRYCDFDFSRSTRLHMTQRLRLYNIVHFLAVAASIRRSCVSASGYIVPGLGTPGCREIWSKIVRVKEFLTVLVVAVVVCVGAHVAGNIVMQRCRRLPGLLVFGKTQPLYFYVQFTIRPVGFVC